VLLNARSLKNKLTDLHSFLRSNLHDLVFVTESWLDDSVTDGLIDPSGCYSVYRHDRRYKVGGGVLALVAKRFHSYQVLVPRQFSLAEVECFEIVTSSDIFRFIVVYRPPEFNSIGRDYMRCLYDCLCYLSDTKHPVIIVGDFNLPHLDWSNRTAPGDDIHSLFLQFCNDFGFAQFVDAPTRDDNVLDLVMSNDPYILSSVYVAEPFSNSDHCAINFTLLLNNHEKFDVVRNIYDFENCNEDVVRQALLSHPFNSMVPLGSADAIWDQFIQPIYKTLSESVPLKVIHSGVGNSSAKRYPAHVNRALHKKTALWRRYRVDRSTANKTNYYQQVEYCRALIYEHEKCKETSVVNQSNLGAFYRFINKRMSCKSGVGPLKSVSGSLMTADHDKATILNNYFCSVFTLDDGSSPTFNRRVANNVSMNRIDITPNDVLKFIKKCKNGMSSGPDGIPQCFLKKFGMFLIRPLSVFYGHLLEIGAVPSDWKLAYVTPIFKKGVSSDVANYRPISLTSVFCKLLERIIHDKMLYYLSAHQLISQHQHGFLARHSTCTQLLETVNDWSIALLNRHVVDVVYFDFAKAFDTVSHTKLICKLQAYGFDGELLSFIHDFVTGRSQKVVLPSGQSSFMPVISGVPQGSVLGPLLFLLFVNDIADLFTNSISIKLFADDIKIYMEINTSSDVVVFQRGVDCIADWANKWQLKLASAKCQFIRIGLRKWSPVKYFLNDCELPRSTVVTDLGINMDSTLSFSDHIDIIVSKAQLRASQILRCFVSKDPGILTRAFVTYVRPLLEYCSTVWSPCSIVAINKLESVQRVFTKKLYGMATISYDDRLKLLGLDRLELRRLHADLITCYKIINHIISVPFDALFKFAATNNTRGHPLKLTVPESRVNARAYAFPVRVINVWNRLPADVVLAPSLLSFKHQVKNVDLTYTLFGKA